MGHSRLHMSIVVGTVIADRPPHGPVRAELPHTVLTADVDAQTSRLHVHSAIRATWLRTLSRPMSGSVFSLVSSLPSPNSAGPGTRPLFAGLFGTMELCDPR
jgi:hypothetical protein